MTGRVLAFVSALVAAAVLAAPAGATEPYASLSGFVCHPANNSLNAYIKVTANVRPMPSTAQMKRRFELQRRVDGYGFRQVYGGDLGRWRSLSLTPWAVTKPVANLTGPALYRFRVSFLWLDSSGSVIRFETLFSPACTQPG